ncbi:MAG: hypothetical protein ABI675_23170 [Chitinophagaceae bacterium]
MKIFLSLIFLFSFAIGFSQKAQFSLATDVSLFHSFKKDQRYYSLGQTITGHFNFTPADGFYVWFAYSSNGKFDKQLDATAKSAITIPQQVSYTNYAKLRFNHISMGWKHYLKGAYNTENTWNLYGYAGFGLLLGIVQNTHSVAIDSVSYDIPVWKGKAKFKRLTIDLGLGYEIPLGGDIYFYMEGRALVPTTDYPSHYLFINDNAPWMGSVNAGLRLLF